MHAKSDIDGGTEPASLVPNRFLFKFELTLRRCAKPPAIDGSVKRWNNAWRLPALHAIDGEDGFADVYVTWDDAGLYVGCEVGGKTRLPQCSADKYWTADNLRLMTDMRDTRQIRRATRFCQQFYFLPSGGGGRSRDPVAGSAKVRRAQEDAPIVPPGAIPIAAQCNRSGYALTAHIPAACLHGFDPAENPRIGLFYMVEDGELGQQSLTIGDDLNWWIDPSTWPTAVLAR